MESGEGRKLGGGRRGRQKQDEEGRAGLICTARRLGHSTVVAQRRREWSHLLFCFFRVKAKQVNATDPRVQAGWTTELSGVEESREISQSGPGRWTVDPPGRLPSVRWQRGRGAAVLPGRPGPASSGLALLHLHRPGLDRSSSLQLGSG